HPESGRSWENFDLKKYVSEEDGFIHFPPETLLPGLYEITPKPKGSCSCKKNCPPVVYIGNVEEETILEVTCSHNCQQAKDKDYEWTIAGSQYDSGKITTGNRGRTFVLSGNVFRPSRNYLLKVSLLRNGKVAGEATFEMTFASKPRAGNCVLYSSARFAVPASFECAEEGAYFYELFAGDTAGRSEHSILTVRTAQSPSRDVCRRFRKRLSSPRVEYTVLEVRRHFPVEYAVWSIPGKILASGYSPDVFYQKFFLPPSGKDKYTVRVSKGIGSSRTLDVSKVVDPEDADRDTPRRKQKYGDRFKMSENSISRLLASTEAKRRKRGVREFQALVENLVIVQVGNTATKKVLRNFKRSIVADLLKVSFRFQVSVRWLFLFQPKKEPLVQELVYVSDGLQILVESKELKKSEPLLSEFTSLICTLIIHKHNEEVKRNPSSGNSQKEAIEFGNALADCLDANSEPDYDLLRPVSYDIVIDEIPSVQFDSVITENYPNYIDVSVDYGQHMENLQLKKFTFNIINSTAMSAKMLLMTTAMGEHDVKSSGKNSATVVARDKGSNLARTRIHLLNFTLHPSMDFADSEHPFDILVIVAKANFPFRRRLCLQLSTWKRDLMWWNHKRTRVATSIVNVQFWHSTCKKRIRHFKAPATVHITMKDGVNFEIQLTEDEIETPKGYGNMSGGDLNSVMRVRRIAIPRHAVLHVNFYNLSLSDALDVVITKSKFPTVDDFAFNTTVRTIGKSFLILPNDEPYDIWGYIGVLPSRRVPSNKTSLSFSMSFTASYCVIWNEEEYVWEPSCVQPGKLNTPRVINCECKHFSVLAGYMQNIPSLPQEVQGVDILLELRPCYIIFATLALTFCVYCVLLTLMTFKIEEEVYYLADNCRDDRYAYLVLVRTENRTDAGTTSAVTIRLTGSKRRGEPHVLNYPDPKMRLLQKQGHDLFVLTTSQHLGELVKMEMWFDCSGPSPSCARSVANRRYCRDVLIYDMQERAEWYFKVKTRFHVYKGVTHLEMGPSGKKLPKLKFFKRFTTCNDYHTWNLWAGETNFEFSAKVTAVFSTLLMMYMLLLVTLGVPSMDLRDCMDAYESYRLSWFSFFAAFMSSLVSYVLHVLQHRIFRVREAVQEDAQSDVDLLVSVPRTVATCHPVFLFRAILIVFIVTSMTCLIVFGFWVPLNNSMIWLTCVVIGTLLDVVVFENAFIIVQTYYCKFRLRYSFDQKFDKFLKVIEQQRVILYQRFDATMLRPFLTHLYKPMRAIEITKRQIIVRLRRVIVDDLEDLLMYGVYNIILYVVILTNRGALTLASKSEMESMFEGAHTRTLPFSKVHSIEQSVLFQPNPQKSQTSFSRVYDYINKTLIPVMQPTIWYMNFGIDDPGMMVDVTSKYIGVARLRQHRIITNACAIPEVISFLNLSCWPEFSLSNAEVRDFGYGWTKYNSGLEYDRLNYIWGHQSEHYTGTLGSMGTISGAPIVSLQSCQLVTEIGDLREIDSK
ncbi:REJ and/or PLAT domain containing protein, partial [Asbolus verrucosus]